MTEQELGEFLRAQGLERVTDAIVALAAPAIGIHVTARHEHRIAVGASKIGGVPDLPPGADWPMWHEPMVFIGQFNLAEVAPYDSEGIFPTCGLLSFFYKTNQEPLYAEMWGIPGEQVNQGPWPEHLDPRSWTVLYDDGDPTTFVRHEAPPTLNAQGRFPSCAVRFSAKATLPYADGAEMRSIGLTEQERTQLFHLESVINLGPFEEGGHHLLGYPYNLEGPALVACAMDAQGIVNPWFDANDEHRLVIEREINRQWRLLLQVSSGSDAQMAWAGAGGLLQFCIKQEALRVQDYGGVWLAFPFL